MIRNLAAALVVWSVLPLPAAKQSFEVTHTERFDFQPGGTIRFENSYGYLTVEGWDEPEVEITVTKSTDRFEDPDWKPKADQIFDQIRVTAERRSNKEIAISTATPRRNSLLTSVLPSGHIIVTTPVPPNNKRRVTVEYAVRVPRDSRLVIHHDNGYVWVSDVTGDLDVNSHTGDLTVMLADPGPYAVDARTRVGSVTSDLGGKATRRFPLGTHFAFTGRTPSRQVHLRMGRGSITVNTGPPSGPFWRN